MTMYRTMSILALLLCGLMVSDVEARKCRLGRRRAACCPKQYVVHCCPPATHWVCPPTPIHCDDPCGMPYAAPGLSGQPMPLVNGSGAAIGDPPNKSDTDPPSKDDLGPGGSAAPDDLPSGGRPADPQPESGDAVGGVTVPGAPSDDVIVGE